MSLKLVSHYLCPYVQRAMITLSEKQVSFEKEYIDLGNKPDWFLQKSPLGKTPLLLADDAAIFESAVIVEYLEDTQQNPLHPADPLERAQHRAWVEFGSSILNDIAGLYSAKDKAGFNQQIDKIKDKFAWLEKVVGEGPFFAGEKFSVVDATFGPIFRYFDVFEEVEDFGFFVDVPKVAAWRRALAARPSVINAVAPEYDQQLLAFLKKRDSFLASKIH
ncbi:glutathione S-transferase family protein [Maritalea mediterranea]|uniref:glutathione transferase n=1 Tax=Maritalea mediterranea TaxID=2909667 RepID=A0ABS9E349_9HYPH|nr:glutathione S-transferase family protein [Maritalea mediterranea]MCF4097296.1 glutathione S-transferase family protein [Maritalea mediterranea]